jgi:hypothetical protein
MVERTSVPRLITDLAQRIGVPAFIEACTGLMAGADRSAYVEELRSLTGHAWRAGDSLFDSQSWPDYWLRTWGARGLLHVWDESATEAVVAGLADEHWRPAEMCLKVTARHEVAGAGDACAKWLTHEMPRVQIQALRALATVGDTHHVQAIRAATCEAHPEVQRQATHTLEQMRSRLDFR